MTIPYQDSKKRAAKNYYYKHRDLILKKQKIKREEGILKETEHRHRSKYFIKYLATHAKCRANKAGLEYTLEWSLLEEPLTCPLLKVPLTKEIGKGYVGTNISLDRIDSSKGYTNDNVWLISRKANTMKSNATKEELIQFSKSILEMEGYTILDRIDNY